MSFSWPFFWALLLGACVGPGLLLGPHNLFSCCVQPSSWSCLRIMLPYTVLYCINNCWLGKNDQFLKAFFSFLCCFFLKKNYGRVLYETYLTATSYFVHNKFCLNTCILYFDSWLWIILLSNGHSECTFIIWVLNTHKGLRFLFFTQWSEVQLLPWDTSVWRGNMTQLSFVWTLTWDYLDSNTSCTMY